MRRPNFTLLSDRCKGVVTVVPLLLELRKLHFKVLLNHQFATAPESRPILILWDHQEVSQDSRGKSLGTRLRTTLLLLEDTE